MTLGQRELKTPPGLTDSTAQPNVCGASCTSLVRPLTMVSSALHMHQVTHAPSVWSDLSVDSPHIFGTKHAPGDHS